MPSPLVSSLLDLLDEGFNKTAWHGPNLLASIRRLDHVAAAKVIVKGRKTIWEQVLHAAFWKQRVLNQLVGTQRFPRSPANWPRVPQPPTADAWRADIALLVEIQGKLRAAVAHLRDDQLTPKLLKFIRGAAMHDVYHAGQINLLKRHMKDS
jgi:hypothetical protein